MPSVIALRALLGAGLGLGAFDLLWINAALAPRLVEREVEYVEPTSTDEAPTPDEAIVVMPPPASEQPARSATTETFRVYFDTGAATLGSRARDTLSRLFAEAPPGARFVLDGYADHRGTEALNESLRKDRAVAVQEQLVRLGVDRARIEVRYDGEATRSDELWRDRRVEIQVTGGTR
jgi:outer membrane protein OmpA-like peptidoglycan-associated protein